ncbi:EvpB/family type VI secretion protein, partial [Candidatus Magnetomorum sp. HK-1]
MSKSSQQNGKEITQNNISEIDSIAMILDQQEIMKKEKVEGLINNESILKENNITIDKEFRENAVKELALAVIEHIEELTKTFSKTDDKNKRLEEESEYFNKTALINKAIQKVEEQMGDILNQIIHHKKFQKLEASWSGLKQLVYNTETNERLKIKVLNAQKKELLRDMKIASDFDQSTLFKKIYEDQFGTFGGDAFGVIIGDYEFDHSNLDLDLLEGVSGVAAAAHAPFIAAASKELFSLEDDFRELPEIRDVEKIFGNVKFARWNSFRKSDDSKYIALTLPHVLSRLPYGEDNPLEILSDFKEDLTE